jgi:hypothetical protein
MKRTLFAIIVSVLTITLNAQQTVSEADTVKGVYYLLKTATYDGVTYPQVELREIRVYAHGKRKYKFDYRKYTRLVSNVKRVYPYALLVRNEMSRVNTLLETMPEERQRRNFLQQYEKDIFKQYEEDISHLSLTQARILIKLIDRETQATSFDLIREYRGKFSASFWQGIARIFGTNLKSTYDAEGEDFMIEQIIMEIDAGRL